ncbi:hypothetical protein Zmor_016964 [Zophobas morio]|uniref:Protein takeout n=2 Tax=Zophobas morio TaxID=2755281 RepID=A0AA38MC22_9CUCU|nr:hypothetical protein Zmor_016964 [Zophobas morio]
MQLIITLVLVAPCLCINLPHSFKKCTLEQPDSKKCVKEAAEYNVHLLIHPFKDLHLPGLKPLLIPSLSIGSGKRAVAVEQHFNDCNIYGFDHVELEKFEFHFDKKFLEMDAHFAEITKKCHYQLNGRVLLLPIRGEGDSTIVLRNMKISGFLPYQEVKRSGKTYLSFDSHNVTFDVGSVYFHFDNLFNGDRGLGDSLNKVLNDNWKQVFDDVKPNYSKVMDDIIQSLLNQFFGRVSLEDAFSTQ